MKLLWYLLEANIYFTVAYLFYLVFLRRYTFFQQHRYYLLFVSVFSFIIPLISGNSQPDTAIMTFADTNSANYRVITLPATQSTAESVLYHPYNLLNVPVVVYWSVALISIIVLIRGLIKIYLLYHHSEKKRQQGMVIALLPHQKTIFSFCGWLFSHPSFIKNELLLEHEKVHIREKHSLDILWFELLKAFNWFNPVSWHLLKSAKLNHEFIVDSQLTGKHDPFQYAMLLIEHAHDHSLPVGHAAFTKTQLEKRMCRMTNGKSVSRSKFLLFLCVPLMLPLVYLSVFSIDKDYALLKFSFVTDEMEKTPMKLKEETSEDKLAIKLSDPVPVAATSGKENIKKKVIPEKSSDKAVAPTKILEDTMSLTAASSVYPSSGAPEKKEAYRKSRYVNLDECLENDKPSVYSRYTFVLHSDLTSNYKGLLKPVSVYPDRNEINSAIIPGEKYSVSLFESTKRPSAFQ
ncbi:MAG: hypothetical protein DI535_20885 [Citrobacter freundii]|nr:MAG: hypothetical protein DI535_20885 [Citrobacter freundii]